MRYTALAEMKVSVAPCIILPESTPVAKLKEIVIKDNGSFGEWEMDMLANEWNDCPLSDWGVNVPVWESEEKPTTTTAKDPNEPIVCTCQKGDVWNVGNQEIMCAGCSSQNR